MSSPGKRPIYTDDWFQDRDGKRWRLVSLDVDGHRVTLELMDKVNREVSLDELRTDFVVVGSRVLLEELEKQRGER